ncbi:MAG: Rne/Rng family ribonuclease [Alphaproteobacteria bacterium]|nr:Rne/Rng family ribonuclease [Alphaproteobacteria bacterium]
MTKRMLIDDTQPEETRVVIVDGNKVEDVEFESSSRKQIKGNVYTAKVIRIEPSLQAAFIDYGGNKRGFLAFNEIHPDYYNVSDDVLAEVEAEVDEIIEGKIQYIKEKEAEKARYRAEKEAIEAQKRLEAQQAQEIEESQLEPVQNVLDEKTSDDADAPEQQNTQDDVAKENTVSTCEEISEPESEEQAEEQPNSKESSQSKSRRKYTRRTAKKSPKTLAEDSGLTDEVLEDEDAELSVDDDDDEDSIADEHNFEIQRKLLRARKLYHRCAIQDVIKEGQILLVQVVKEERGNKGAACTTYISLAGRYCVLMPNRIKSGGVSRKITNVTDRRRLKNIVRELPISKDMSLIVRTAGEDKTKADIVRDYNYLIRTWNAIRYSALKNQPPSIVYEEGNLIKRALRDMYTKDIDEVVIDGDEAYQTARNFVKILSPHNLKNIKCRKSGEIPVFQRFQVEAQLDKLHNPIVQLKSGGYLVINPTEALVSIDVNSGRATKEKDIEETALKTNLEAADEIAKQLKMRDLAGLIVVDFIDMYEPQNNVAIEKRMKEALKDDRARIQVAKMSIFGLLEISRQRMHSSFMESNYEVCPHCHGRGFTRTIESGSSLVLRAIESEAVRNRNYKITATTTIDIATYLLNQKRKQLSALEEAYDVKIIIAGDVDIKDAGDFKMGKEKISVATQAKKDTAATCYEEENVDFCDSQDDSVTSEDEENRRFRPRRGIKSRRFKRDRRFDNGQSVDSERETAQPEKKSWWKKLIG